MDDPARRGAELRQTGASLPTVSGDLEHWLGQNDEPTVGSLIPLFDEKSFALVFVLLLGVPALPVPTGGATHVFEIVAILLSLELIGGRDQICMIRRLERVSHPRLRFPLRVTG